MLGSRLRAFLPLHHTRRIILQNFSGCDFGMVVLTVLLLVGWYLAGVLMMDMMLLVVILAALSVRRYWSLKVTFEKNFA
ncbi:hypothetical protein V7I42_08250 [Raoultella ornithinolytica]|uniref:hypothetical protein n=1 Tax=Raoultella ornithinolytica TaxID=54291 RepID=UPI002FEF3D55